MGVAITDVSVRCVAAMRFAALAHSLIHAVTKHGLSPRKVLLSTHQALLEMGQTGAFVILSPPLHEVRNLAEGTLRWHGQAPPYSAV